MEMTTAVMVVLLVNVVLYLSSRAYRRKLLLAGVGVKHMLLSKDRKYRLMEEPGGGTAEC